MKIVTITKKITPTICLLLIFLNVKGQNIISSRVFDAATKEPMPFVNIGIKKKNIGTVSNETGAFKILIPKDKTNDSLTFSFVGYHSFTIAIKQLFAESPDSIKLKQKTLELPEVMVKANGKWKQKKMGLSRNLPGAMGVVQNDTLFDAVECAQQIDLDSVLTKITSFHIYLKGVKTDTANFRINFYNFDGISPSDRVFEKEIFVKRSISNGWMEVDLDEYNIWLKGRIVVSIEFLPTSQQKEKVSLWYGGILICKGTSYSRTSSQGEWHKLDFGTYSIYVTTKKYVSKK
ncbi:MAG: carboxypeptidase-like regulatory domain-containing protein [Flavobacteriales bacterium]